MSSYYVRLYRLVSLTFNQVDADSPEDAVSTARGFATGRADRIDDFEADRQRRATQNLLAALEYVGATLKLRHLDEASDDEVEEALRISADAIAEGEAAGIAPTPTAPVTRLVGGRP